MARFKTRGLGLATVLAIAIGVATLALWQDRVLTVQAAQEGSTYVVERGDSLFSIAKKVDVNLEALASANDLAIGAPLNRGQKLVIPSAESMSAPAQDAQAARSAESGAEMVEEAEAEATPEATEEMAEEMAEEATETRVEEAANVPDAAPSAVGRTYEVQAGDSLFSIAKKFHVSQGALAAANNLKPGAILYRGMLLTIPGDTPAAPAAAAPPSAAPEATEEVTEDVVVTEATAEPTEEMAEEVAEEATPEPTEEVVEEEATPEATEEMAEEMAEEATPEATEEMIEEEATLEATEEMIEEEATPEATEEMIEEEATPEATEEMIEEVTILDTITEMGDFTILLEALAIAGLDETLTTEGPFTLFAPTDAAFEALPEGTIDGLLATSPDDLSQILLYHLLPGKILTGDFVDGVTIITAQGGPVTIGITPDGFTINGALITISDIETSNGVIHIIDAVLLPTTGVAAVPRGTAAAEQLEAASGDAASVIVVPVRVTDMVEAAQNWPQPDASITLFSPVATGGYHSPIDVIGLSNTFGGHVAIDLTTPEGTVLAQRMTLGGEEAYAFFQTSLRFYIDEATDATLSVHEIDMADGSILHTVEAPLTLLPGQRFLDVTSPVVGQFVCDPILVSGYSNTFEANVVLSLYAPDAALLTQLPTMGGSMGVYRDFATPLPYPSPNTVSEATPVLVSVAETDAAGILTTVDEKVIPVTLYPAYSAACY